MYKKCLHLTGYFDRNFGDDMMMQLVVRSLPEITFLVEDTADTPVLSEPNVVAKDRKTCGNYPKLVVTGSGFMINTKAALRAELLRFLRGKCPGDYCLGCNIEPLGSPVKRFLISRKLNRFKLITCRDWASYSWLRYNTKKPQIHLLPDLLFSIPDQWLPQCDQPELLGISLMHRAGDKEDCSYYRAMAEAADRWIQNTGKDVLLIAFDTGKEDDLFACRSVRDLMQFPDKAQIVAHREGTEVPEAFACCKKVIGARFHSMVLALRMGIQLYPLIFREKARNMLQDIQYPFPVCDIDDIDKTSLHDFLDSEQKPYSLEKGIYAGAGEHTQLLKQQLVQ